MSRIGKQLIVIPPGVEAKVSDDILIIKGPKGQLSQKLHPQISLDISEGKISVKVKNELEKPQRALWGLFGSLIKNMVDGVISGFEKKLEINGVGMKAALSGRKLVLNVGFSHPVDYQLPEGINLAVEGNIIAISGIDKQLVGETAAQIRKIKPVEPYKGKGLKYVGEKYLKKAGKAAAKTAIK